MKSKVYEGCKMILEMYTTTHDPKYHNGRELTKEIQAESRSSSWRQFTTADEYYDYYSRLYPDMVDRAKHLIDFCQDHHIRSVLSLGAGESITEITLKRTMPNPKITCTDYDPFIIAKSRSLFEEINFLEFDMKRPDVAPHRKAL